MQRREKDGAGGVRVGGRGGRGTPEHKMAAKAESETKGSGRTNKTVPETKKKEEGNMRLQKPFCSPSVF